MSFVVVIPARFASTRLPGKLLLDLAGKPMIQHVYEKALASGAERVVVATDHQDIAKAVEQFSGEAVLTADTHPQGTDRIAEATDRLGLDDDTLIVNVQGDEPLIEPDIIRNVAQNLAQQQQASMATMATPITNMDDLLNPNVVKVVFDEYGFALYFSRAPIPWLRDQFANLSLGEGIGKDVFNNASKNNATNFYRHIGIYAYHVRFLKIYVALRQNSLEKAESLEQLRALGHGYKIHVGIASKHEALGVDTREQYLQIKTKMER